MIYGVEHGDAEHQWQEGLFPFPLPCFSLGDRMGDRTYFFLTTPNYVATLQEVSFCKTIPDRHAVCLEMAWHSITPRHTSIASLDTLKTHWSKWVLEETGTLQFRLQF